MAITTCIQSLLICLLYKEIFSEPICSKFAYEEQLLEKMVRLEFNVEQMEKEIKNTNSLVHEALLQLKQNWEKVTKEHENQKTDARNELKQNMETLTQKYEDIKKETKNTVDENVNKIKTEIELINKEKAGLIERIDDKMVELTERVSVPTIAFKARTQSRQIPVANQIIVFAKTLVDTGNTYNNSTGIFTAPVDGTYLLTCQLCPYQSKHITFGIFVGDTRYTVGTFYEKNAYICFNIETTAAMTTGQTASVKSWSLSSGQVLYDDEMNRWNVFTGTLIHK